MGTVLLRSNARPRLAKLDVSVPFSIGTVLLPMNWLFSRWRWICFSPLLDGDGVASIAHQPLAPLGQLFQSPSRWGRCCFLITRDGRDLMGKFQSPSRWGRCCFDPNIGQCRR